ncbi:MAG: DUF2201 family putative metallopeptidase, partial [bacterium]
MLVHELLHAALLHSSRNGGRDPELWNVAADIVINGIIDEHAHGGPKPKPVVWAHSQWCILSRRHAEILCDSNPVEERRRKLWLSAYAKALTNDDVNKNLTLAPDELFIL